MQLRCGPAGGPNLTAGKIYWAQIVPQLENSSLQRSLLGYVIVVFNDAGILQEYLPHLFLSPN
jgi:hypothetical protein